MYKRQVNETTEKSESLPFIKAGYKSDISKSLTEMGYLHEVSDGGEWAGESKSVKTIQLRTELCVKMSRQM